LNLADEEYLEIKSSVNKRRWDKKYIKQ
jgi:hypothetical protein